MTFKDPDVFTRCVCRTKEIEVVRLQLSNVIEVHKWCGGQYTNTRPSIYSRLGYRSSLVLSLTSSLYWLFSYVTQDRARARS